MTIEEIKKAVQGPEYDFLRTNEHLGNRLILLTLGGSHAYGKNVETSDVDIRGCAMERPQELIGLNRFEQVIDTKTDTVVYGFNKLVKLLAACNPNTIELLGCKPEHYIFTATPGQQLIENQKLFLSQAAANSFGGYAAQQLARLENAIARDALPQPKKERHIMNSLRGAQDDAMKKYLQTAFGDIELYQAKSEKPELEEEIFANVGLKNVPVRSFKSLLSELSNVLDSYEKTGHQNHKKDQRHLCKHAMHLIRLYLMAFDILERGEVNSYRENERDELLAIRNGKYLMPDGTFAPEFFEMVDDMEKRLKYAKENTSLPKRPDMKKIEEFVMDINRQAINGK